MRKLIFLLSAWLLISGCRTQKRMSRICSLCPHDSIVVDHVNTVYRDSLIAVPLDPDTIRVQDSIPCDKIINLPVKRIVSGMVTAEAFVVNNILFLNAFVNKDSVKVLIKNATKTTVIEHTSTVTRNVPTIIKKTPFSNWVIMILEGILILCFFYFLFKPNLRI